MENKENNHQGTPPNPYKALYSYEEEDEDIFYGRETETKNLHKLVKHNFLTVVFGKSGIGKTSLINAGLFPKIRENEYLPIKMKLDYSSSSAGLIDQVREAINQEIEEREIKKEWEGEKQAKTFGPSETLWEYFHRTMHFDESGRKVITPVLVFDQFEEIFTLGKNRKEVDVLLDELYYLIENQFPDSLKEQILKGEVDFYYGDVKPTVRVILSLREDFLPHLNSLKSRIPSIDRVLFRIIHLNGEQAKKIIGMPGGIQDKNVVKGILRLFYPEEVGEDEQIPDEKLEIEPSILSLLCYQLYEREKKKDKKDTKLITKGDQDKILTDFYDSVLEEYPPDVEDFIESKLLTEGGFRTPFYLERDHPLKDSIESLVKQRILRPVHYGEKKHIEIIHDVLAPIIREKRNRRLEEERIKELEKEKEREYREKLDKQQRRQRWTRIVAGIAISVVVILSMLLFWNLRLKRDVGALSEEKRKLDQSIKETKKNFNERLADQEKKAQDNLEKELKEKEDKFNERLADQEKKAQDNLEKELKEKEDEFNTKQKKARYKYEKELEKAKSKTFEARIQGLIEKMIGHETLFTRYKAKSLELASHSKVETKVSKLKALLALWSIELFSEAYRTLGQSSQKTYNDYNEYTEKYAIDFDENANITLLCKNLIDIYNSQQEESTLFENEKENLVPREIFEALREAYISLEDENEDIIFKNGESWAISPPLDDIVLFNNKDGKILLASLECSEAYLPKIKNETELSEIPVPISSIAETKNRLFCGTQDGAIYHLDKNTLHSAYQNWKEKKELKEKEQEEEAQDKLEKVLQKTLLQVKHKNKILAMAFSTTKNHLFYSTGKTLYEHNLKDQPIEIKTFENEDSLIRALAVVEKAGSENIYLITGGTKIRILSGNRAKGFYEDATIAVTYDVVPNGRIHAMAYCRAANKLALGYSDGKIYLSEDLSFKHLNLKKKIKFKQLIPAHEGIVRTLAFNTEGMLLASGSWDGTLKLWISAKESYHLALTIDSDSKILSAVFDPQGKHIIFCDEQNIRICPTSPTIFEDVLRNKDIGELKSDQWESYFGKDIEYRKKLPKKKK